MKTRSLRILLIMEQCNSDWPSVPRVAYNIYQNLRQLADVTLVTHERNREALSSRCPNAHIDFIAESPRNALWFRWVHKLTGGGATNWPLMHALSFPIYAEFNRLVYRRYHKQVEDNDYDAVICTTPILPRYPYAISRACKNTPFIIGPVNGGLPFPKGFQRIAKEESAHFNFLRHLGRMIPGYMESYHRADRILTGSEYTKNWIHDALGIKPEKLVMMPENGVSQNFFHNKTSTFHASRPLRLLFAGRLVPYKGADMVIESMKRIREKSGKTVELVIAGSGPEEQRLRAMTTEYNLGQQVKFAGHIPPDEMPALFAGADVFAFPSVREFGGAVVLEAMAGGVPCIVVNHGGIGEYVTEASGWKIAATSRDHIVSEIAETICSLIDSPDLLHRMANASRNRAFEYSWAAKVEKILAIVQETIAEKQKRAFGDNKSSQLAAH